MRKPVYHLLLLLFGVMLTACSEDSKTELTEVDAQKAYNDVKGTYKGVVLDENVPTPVYLTIGQDFSIRDLPVTPLLKRFLSGKDLDAAVASVKERVFKAPTSAMSIMGDLVYITMEPTDWVFTATVGDKKYDVNALISVTVRYTHTYDKLSANIVVDELFCNSQKADLSSNAITWLIDEAAKQ
jgi:hypothetical protein